MTNSAYQTEVNAGFDLDRITLEPSFQALVGNDQAEADQEGGNSSVYCYTSLYGLRPISRPAETLDDTLNRLASKVEADSSFMSSPFQIALHPDYQEIVSLGSFHKARVLSFLVKRLNISPTTWLLALETLTNNNPVPASHKGVISLMMQDWKDWAKRNGV